MEVLRRIDSASWVIAAASAATLLAGHLTIPLWDQDEAAYAGFAYTMAVTGDWVIPRFWWSDVHRKPPLHLWLTAVSLGLLGKGTLALRLPATVAYAASLLLLARWGAQVFGRRVALVASLVLASSPVLLIGKLGVTDSLLLLTETAGCLALIRYLQAPSRRWAITFWLALSAGLLTKGPPALIVSGGMFFLLLSSAPLRGALWRLRPWLGLPLALLPLLTWGWLAWTADGGTFIRWMIDWYILQRGSGVFGQTAPPGAYLASFTVLLFPWFWLLPAAVVRVVTSARHDWRSAALLSWLAAAWLLYEAIPSKLPTYALGAYPALALIIARELAQVSRNGMGGLHRAGLVVHGSVLIGLGAAAGVAPGLLHASSRWPFYLAGGLILILGGLGFWSLARGAVASGVLLSAAATLSFLLVLVSFGVPALESRLHATARVTREVARHVPGGSAVGVPCNLRLPSLPLSLIWAGYEPTCDQPTSFSIVTEEPAGPALARIDGWIPDRGRRVRYWIVAR